MGGITWAILAYKEKSAIIYSIVTHGGYPDHTGVVLKKHFDSPMKAKCICSFGRIPLVVSTVLDRHAGTPSKATDIDDLFVQARKLDISHVYLYDEEWSYSPTAEKRFSPLYDIDE